MDDLRGALESAFDNTPEEEESSVSVDSPEDSGGDEPVAEATESASQRARDEQGRFARKEERANTDDMAGSAPTAPKAPPQAAAQPQDQQAQQPTAPSIPPIINASAPATVREHWASLPAEVQQWAVQREQQVQHVLQESASARNIANKFSETISPYMTSIKAAGVDPMQAIDYLLSVETKLRFGTPQEKAATIARVVQSSGVDIGLLDSALAGAAPTMDQQQQGFNPQIVQQMVQQQLAPIMQAAQQRRQMEEQRITGEVQNELSQFAKQHEFYNDVRTLMADAIEIAERQGYNLTLEDAYARACTLHPEVSRVIMARQQQQSAQSLNQAAQRAKGAAVSVRGAAPVGRPDGPEPSSVREAIEAAIELNARV